ncbi:MAG TPA: dephospho-CoA kinase [Candidatus Nanopelagicaceae bacterium]|nr:dephospho-CoA kinase [Candidatus Nanopelagicaceae bacterium]
MLKVALTGGIGSGKSTVADFLDELGAYVIDSDQLAREVVERGTSGYEAVLAAFGDGILTDGEIDRAKLAEIVFKDATARATLESIIHPLVRDAAEKMVKSLPADAVVINQIPLLVETDGAKRFDFVITVSADEDIRRRRLIERGMKDYEITKRLAAQVNDAAREAIAHSVIRNNGSIDELRQVVEELWRLELLPRSAEQ